MTPLIDPVLRYWVDFVVKQRVNRCFNSRRIFMKRFFAALMAVLFLGMTTVVMADEAAAPAATPMVKAMKKHKKAKKAKKVAAEAAPAASTTPAAK